MKNTKKQIRKAAAAVLAFAMTFSFAACGGDGGDSPADAIQKAQEKMGSVTSMSYDMLMNMEMTADGQTVAMDTTAVVNYIVDPLAMKMEMQMAMGDYGTMNSTSYIVDEGESCTMYTGTDFGGEMTWSKQTLGDLAAVAQYDAKENFELYLKSAESFKENGTETINGVKAVRYDGVISEDALKEVMDSTGTLSQLDSLGISQEETESVLGALADVPFSIWISEADYMPVKYEMDMTELMQKMMAQMAAEEPDNGAVDVTKMFISVTIKDINSVDPITVPQDILDSAVEVSV